MEFLDSLDLDTIHKKSHRVRSWYLYEQFKSLERSQLDAAQKLKDRSYQERILRQELSERRARRKLYDQFGLCQSEPRLKRDSKSNYRTTTSTSDDDFLDFFDNLNLMHEEERVTQVTRGNEFSGEGEGDTFSQDAALTHLSVSQCCLPNNYASVQEHKDDNGSYAGSVTSVVHNLKPNDEFLPPNDEFLPPNDEFLPPNDEFLPPQEDFLPSKDDFLPPKEIGFMLNSPVDEELKNSIADDLNMQLDSVKLDIECLEQIAKLEDLDKISDSFNKATLKELKHLKVSKKPDPECNVVAIWSRLVSFAYQVVKLNHGNCYCDYSSQFLTAVLACDVLRRGVNRMCHILQPYVSPIEFARDESDVSDTGPNLNDKQKKSVQFRKCRKICEIKPLSRKKPKKFVKTRRSAARKNSQNSWKPFYTESLYSDVTENTRRYRRAFEPRRRRSAKILHYREEISSRSSSTGRSSIFKEKSRDRQYSYTYQNRALHPMLKIARCIDSILKDIDDSKKDM